MLVCCTRPCSQTRRTGARRVRGCHHNVPRKGKCKVQDRPARPAEAYRETRVKDHHIPAPNLCFRWGIGSISWQVQFPAGYVMVSQDIRRRVPRDRWLPIGESRTCRPRTSYGRVCVPEARADLRRTTSMSARAPQVGQTRSALAWPELQPEGARCPNLTLLLMLSQ